MQVDVLASSVIRPGVLNEAYGYKVYNPDALWSDVEDLDLIAEAAGRICYMSWDRPNPATAHTDSYLANIIKRGHTSVMEHSTVTFLVQDVSRSLLAELTRHRHLSPSVVSQRYVNYINTDPVIPPALESAGNTKVRDADGVLISYTDIVESHYRLSLGVYNKLYQELRDQGHTVKEAREAARSVLPNSAPCDLIITGNVRAWRDVLHKRYHIAADKEITKFATLVLARLREEAPGCVQDIPAEPFGAEYK